MNSLQNLRDIWMLIRALPRLRDWLRREAAAAREEANYFRRYYIDTGDTFYAWCEHLARARAQAFADVLDWLDGRYVTAPPAKMFVKRHSSPC